MGYSTFTGINTALRGLMAQQAALDVTGHNISNVGTEGYSRQRVDMTAATPLMLPSMGRTMPAELGTGVNIASFTRMRDQFVDRTIRGALGDKGSSNTEVGSLKQVQGAFQELGIADLTNRFFSALDGVAANPQDMAARQAFVQSGDALARGVNDLTTELKNVAAQSDARLNQSVSDINNITQQLAALNVQIGDAVNTGQQPNDLLDKRDQLMDQLAGKVNYTYTTNAAQQVTITFGTITPINLVDPAIAGPPPGYTAVTRANLDTAFGNGDLKSGDVFADEKTWDPANGTVAYYLTRMDNLTNSMVTQLNAQNGAGFDLTGAPGGPLFTPLGPPGAPGWASSAMQFNPAVLGDPRLVAAASSWVAPGEPGNGNNANAMEALRSVVQGPPLNATWEDFHRATVADIGTRTQLAMRTLDNQTALVDSLKQRRDDTSGVSLDEEMSNMLRFQHAYNAAARLMTAFDQNLDTLINRMGKVGL